MELRVRRARISLKLSREGLPGVLPTQMGIESELKAEPQSEAATQGCAHSEVERGQA